MWNHTPQKLKNLAPEKLPNAPSDDRLSSIMAFRGQVVELQECIFWAWIHPPNIVLNTEVITHLSCIDTA